MKKELLALAIVGLFLLSTTGIELLIDRYRPATGMLARLVLLVGIAGIVALPLLAGH